MTLRLTFLLCSLKEKFQLGGDGLQDNDCFKFYEEMFSKMNEEQRYAFERLQEAAEDDEGGSRLFFLEGPGGTGKTYVYRCLYYYLRSKGVKVRLLE